MPIKPPTPDSFKDVPPCGYCLKAPATDAQRKLLTDAGYRQMTESDIKALGLGNIPDKRNVWWQIRAYPDLIPSELIHGEPESPEKSVGAVPAKQEEPKREELDMDLER